MTITCQWPWSADGAWALYFTGRRRLRRRAWSEEGEKRRPVARRRRLRRRPSWSLAAGRRIPASTGTAHLHPAWPPALPVGRAGAELAFSGMAAPAAPCNRKKNRSVHTEPSAARFLCQPMQEKAPPNKRNAIRDVFCLFKPGRIPRATIYPPDNPIFVSRDTMYCTFICLWLVDK